MAQFAALESALDKPEARAAYAQLVDDNVGAALSLYGASTRVGYVWGRPAGS